MRGPSSRILLGVLLVAVAHTGCGSGDEPLAPEPRHPLTDVVHRLQDRFEAQDVQGVCGLMTRTAQIQAGRVGHGEPTTCPRDLRRAFGMIDDGGGWLEGDAPRVIEVRPDDHDRAAVVTVGDDDWKARIPFSRERGGWKLAGFFGMELDRFERLERGVRSRQFPAPGRPVRVSKADGTPCGHPTEARYPDISGGCVLRVAERSVRLEMLTPFGGFKFDDCSITYEIHTDESGRTWTDAFDVSGGGPQSGCADVLPCRRPYGVNFENLPWKGRLRVADDRSVTLHVDMCLRTCIGMFAGELVLDLEAGETPSGWRADTGDAGESGIRFEGSMDMAGARMAIVAGERPGG